MIYGWNTAYCAVCAVCTIPYLRMLACMKLCQQIFPACSNDDLEDQLASTETQLEAARHDYQEGWHRERMVLECKVLEERQSLTEQYSTPMSNHHRCEGSASGLGAHTLVTVLL